MHTAITPSAKAASDLNPPVPSAVRDAASSFQRVAIDSIFIPPGPRESITAASLSDLANNIRDVGVLQPIIIRAIGGRRFELVAGERRIRAAKIADLAVIPAMVLHGPSADRETVSLFENIHRQNLSQIEEARVLKHMLQQKGSLDQVAKAINKSKPWISERLQLLELGPAAASLVVDGVTSDVDVINAVNRAARLDAVRAEQLAREVRAADKKREVARRGLGLIKHEVRASSSVPLADAHSRRDLGRLAAEIIRIGNSAKDRATRAREMRQTLSCSSNGCRETLQALLRSAFDLGRLGTRDFAASLNRSSDDLLELMHGKPRLLQQLLLRAYSVALTTSVFDFQQVAIG